MKTENKSPVKKAVLSCSGGMDSTGLLLNLLANNYSVEVINFDYGSKQNSIEQERLKANIKYLQDSNLPVIMHHVDLSSIMGLYHSALTSKDIDVPEGHYQSDNMKSTVVPNRNSIFAALIYGLALSIAQRDECEVSISLGIHSGDHQIYPDCRPEYMTSLYELFGKGNWDTENVKLYIPYVNFDKTYILKDTFLSCKKLNLDFNTVLSNTLTCYKPDTEGKSCGKCGSCTERLEAFANIGHTDPVQYVESK